MTKLYLACAENQNYIKILSSLNVKNILISFDNLSLSKRIKELVKNFRQKPNVFLDCGAHSIRKRGELINPYAYIDYIKRNLDFINVYPSIDIGTFEEIQKNLKIIEDRELKPIPVYLYDWNNFKVIEEYCGRYPYIAIGAIADKKDEELDITLTPIFEIVKRYKTKVHLFGITDPNIIKKFPAYSCDSRSWATGSMYGLIWIFNELKGELKSLKYKDVRWHDFSYIMKERGIDLKKIREGNNDELDKWNCLEWIRYAEYLEEYHYPYWEKRRNNDRKIIYSEMPLTKFEYGFWKELDNGRWKLYPQVKKGKLCRDNGDIFRSEELKSLFQKGRFYNRYSETLNSLKNKGYVFKIMRGLWYVPKTKPFFFQYPLSVENISRFVFRKEVPYLLSENKLKLYINQNEKKKIRDFKRDLRNSSKENLIEEYNVKFTCKEPPKDIDNYKFGN